mmetsp:Transcript_33431/g.69931  ORF Transcript_33431/g.69931 Transcript_33431/m.69931 type:complete len:286 (+) Transcript_33431:64-921(+)
MALVQDILSAFPNNHLVGSPVKKNLSSGAHPLSTFPNDHFRGSSAAAPPVWAASQASHPVAALRAKVEATNWEELFNEGQTMMRAEAKWSAGTERCELLRLLCAMSSAERVLEVGAFCGVASLNMAETLPEGGELVALEVDPFMMDFGRQVRAGAGATGQKISHLVGFAADSLKDLAERAAAGKIRPFNLALIDANKAGMRSYLELLLSSPGLLSEEATICIDVTPFKGQPPLRYIRFGQADKWVVPSGQDEIDALRASVKDLAIYDVHETGGLIILRRKQAQQL